MATFRLTKIHELPKQEFNDIKDTDILVIENEVDTWHISVGDLKVVFSCDEKINAIYQNLLNRIENANGSVEDITNIFNEFLNNYRTQIEELINNINKNTQNIVEIKNEITNIHKAIEIINDTLTDHGDRITNIEIEIEKHEKKITDLTERVDQHDIDIEALKKKDQDLQRQIDELKKQVQQIIIDIDGIGAVSETLVRELINNVHIEINNKYEEIMQILDDKFHQTPIIV